MLANHISADRLHLGEPPFSMADTPRYVSMADTHKYGHGADILATSEPLGWRSMLVIDTHIHAGASAASASIKDHVIVLQLNGTVKLDLRLGDLRGTKTTFPGQISIVPGGTDTESRCDNESIIRSVYLRASIVTDILRQMGIEDRAFLLPKFSIIDPVLSGLIYGCAKARDWQNVKSSAYIDHFAWTMAAHLTENYSNCSFAKNSNEHKPLSNDALRIVDEYIRAHLAHDIGVTDIARAAGYSPGYFTKIFKHTVGVPPYKYLLNHRVHAVRDALHTKACLADIAVATGFCNQEHMTRAFRQFHGITPSHYRREARHGLS